MRIVTEPFELFFADDLVLQFIYPLKDLTNKRLEELNNSSIVNRLVFGDFSVLMTGDAEVEVEEDLMNVQTLPAGRQAPMSKLEIKIASNILKLGHHGSTSSSSEEFLEAVDPELAIAQVGEGNSFGHPSLRVLKRLERLEISLLRNDLVGRISVYSDGVDYRVESEF